MSLVCLLGNIPPIPSIHPFLSCLKAQLRQMQRSAWHLLPTFGCDADLSRVPHPLFPLHVVCIKHVICSCSFGQPKAIYQCSSVLNEKHVRAEYGTAQDYLSGPPGHTDWSWGPTQRFWDKLASKKKYICLDFCVHTRANILHWPCSPQALLFSLRWLNASDWLHARPVWSCRPPHRGWVAATEARTNIRA